MSVRSIFGSALLLVGVLGATAANADNCSLKLANTVPLNLAQDGTRALLPVTINGSTETFLLDTGGFATQITADAAARLKLPVVDSPVRMLDLYGHASSQAVRADSFQLGRMQDKNSVLPILINIFGDKAPFVGLLAADYMGHYDVELDFAGGKMNYILADNCDSQVVYWPSAAMAVIPFKFRDHHLILDVALDGHPVRAEIDTGSPGTTLTVGAAKRLFGIAPDSSGAKVPEGSGSITTFGHVFQKLSFEGLEVNNPHVAILPDLVGSKDANNDFVTGSRVHRVDDADASDPVMLIGMNILTKLHLYIAFKQGKLYVTPAGAAPAGQPVAPAK